MTIANPLLRTGWGGRAVKTLAVGTLLASEPDPKGSGAGFRV